MEPGFVSLDGVSHRYGGIAAGPEGVLAVQDLTININRGEFAAVVGPSGCGKSTLMKLATGLQFPFAGHVRVADAEVTQPLKIAGMAFQAPTLAALAHHARQSAAAARNRAAASPRNPPQQGRNMSTAPRSCSLRSGSAASAANFPGNCPAACSSAPRSAAR